MDDVYVVGIGMTPFGKFLDTSVKQLTQKTVEQTLADAKCPQDAIGAAYFSNTTQRVLDGQYLVPAQMALRDMGFEGIPISNVENACASASTAFQHAYTAIKAGQTDVALAIGVEKMYDADKAKSFEIFDGAWDVYEKEQTQRALEAMGDGVEPPEGVNIPNGQRSVFMDIYAAFAKFHMKTFGSTPRQLAAISAKNHGHSALNPLSQYQNTYSVDEVLNARLISWPLTLPMCSPISDGGAAAILCSRDALDRFDKSRALPVKACVLGSGINREVEEVEKHITHLTANRAYEQAGIGPNDISVAEVHDATAFGEVTQAENLGFCEFGQGGVIAERGETSLGGRIPINTSGGLESKGHPIGATGLGQLYELGVQLRGEAGERQVDGATFAVAENGGGIYRIEEATCCVTILGGPTT
ncbi:MAG: thiolase family protein [Gammaproteobacteria bacterium]|nr:thiolase family protein [Gammaproteobacteria bacterium]